MKLQSFYHDKAVLMEIGNRLARRRLDLNLTQAVLATEAGVAKRTVERIEAGGSIQLSTFVRLMRVLGLIDGLEQALPESEPRPMELLKLKGRQRRRASGSAGAPDAGGRVMESGSVPWTWGDEPEVGDEKGGS